MDAPATAGRGLARNVRIFGATSFLNDTATEMAYWILPAFRFPPTFKARASFPF